MSWRDRGYDDDERGRMGRPGGDWQGIRPSFDNPMSWSVPLVRVLRVAVRVHVVFLLYIVIELGRSLPKESDSPHGFGLTALWLGCLFAIVLIHEFGHVLACRWSGGEADEILMWPLGGLAFCRPEQHWRAHLVTAIGGPAVNVVIFLILAPVLALLTGKIVGVAIPNPLALDLHAATIDGRQPWWLLTLFVIHSVSFILLLFNLLPIFPLDGGRIVQACLWARTGYARSMRLAVYSGYIGAIVLGIGGFVMREFMLVGIAFFGGITCWWTLKQLQWTASILGEEDDLYAQSLWGGDEPGKPGKPGQPGQPGKPETPARVSRAEKKATEAAEADAAESAEVDRILAKIAVEGLESLNARERKFLKQATERKRRGAD